MAVDIQFSSRCLAWSPLLAVQDIDGVHAVHHMVQLVHHGPLVLPCPPGGVLDVPDVIVLDGV